jgi:hypothetical protein
VLDIETSDRLGRLRELVIAITTTLREQRNAVVVDEQAGPALAKLIQDVAPVTRRTPRGAKLVDTALALVELLDELLAIDFTLIADPDAYAPLAVVARWWSLSTYPSPIADGLRGIVRKLTSAVRLRARLGQRSENLVLRLRQALGSGDAATDALTQIAETESGLTPDMDDWLRGRARESSVTADALTSLLSRTSTPMLTDAIAPLLLDSIDATLVIAQDSASPLAGHLRRLCGRIQALAAELK